MYIAFASHVVMRVMGLVSLWPAQIQTRDGNITQTVWLNNRRHSSSDGEVLVQRFLISSVSYGGILLPPTCKINYVNMQHNYANIRLIYVDMQQYNVESYFFLRVNFLTNAIIWHYTCNIIMFTCDLFMSSYNIIMCTCNYGACRYK